MMPDQGGDHHQGNHAPLVHVDPCGRCVGDGEEELAGGHADLQRRTHEQVQDRDIRPPCTQPEHPCGKPDGDEEDQSP